MQLIDKYQKRQDNLPIVIEKSLSHDILSSQYDRRNGIEDRQERTEQLLSKLIDTLGENGTLNHGEILYIIGADSNRFKLEKDPEQ
jgi:hypothetical protein